MGKSKSLDVGATVFECRVQSDDNKRWSDLKSTHFCELQSLCHSCQLSLGHDKGK